MKKKAIIITSIILAFIVLMIILMQVGKMVVLKSSIDVESILKENNIRYEVNDVASMQYNAISGKQVATYNGTAMLILKYDINRDFYKKIKETGKMYIEGTDVDYTVDIYGDTVIYIQNAGGDIEQISNLLKK